jgi:hypothetical protein
MLNQDFFKFQTIRKVIVAFGTIFNEIQIVRFTKSGIQHNTINVPLIYSPKEKYITRLTSDPLLTKSINTILPRMSFVMDGIYYDSSRKQVTGLKNHTCGESAYKEQGVPVPYNFDFTLSLYVRNAEDGTQILEQILPYFTPDYTVSVNFMPEMGKNYNLPITLNSVSNHIEYEGDFTSTRLIIWDLTFTAKGYIWPPIKGGGGLIGTYSTVGGPDGTGGYGAAFTNIYVEKRDKLSQYVTVDYANGFGKFYSSEIIDVKARQVTGTMIYFSDNSLGTLVLGGLNKLVEVGDIVMGYASHARYTVTEVRNQPVKAVMIITKPDPEDAEPSDDYGFSETIIEYD